jgi:hypothetical protein
VLVERLTGMGFTFGPNWWDQPNEVLVEGDRDEEHPGVFSLPKPQAQGQILELERHAGLIPLSLRAWYESIGSVNLVGSFPVLDPSDPDGLTSWTQYDSSFPTDAWSVRGPNNPLVNWGEQHDLDPLYVAPIERPLNAYRDEDSEDKVWAIHIAPDEHFKYGYSGGGSYHMIVPNTSVDGVLKHEWHETTFVNYLCICFKWGGFPGLATKKHPSRDVLSYLTDSLLPI